MKFFIIIFIQLLIVSVLAGPSKKTQNNNENMNQFQLPSCPLNLPYTKDCWLECYNDSDCLRKNAGKCVI